MLYLILALVIGDVVLGYCLVREKRRHQTTANALRFWRRYQGRDGDVTD